MRPLKLALGIILILVIALYGFYHFTKCKMKHSYKVHEGYIGEIIQPLQPTVDDTYKFVTFNNQKIKYFNNPRNNDYFGNKEKILAYLIHTGLDTLIIPINPSIKNNQNENFTGDGNKSNGEPLVVKGKFGCFPSFIADQNGNILFAESNNDFVTIVLPLAVHKESESTSVIEVLNYYNFKVSLSDYNTLNNYFKNTNPNIDGGVDCAWFWDCDRKRLRVYDGSITIYNEIEY